MDSMIINATSVANARSTADALRQAAALIECGILSHESGTMIIQWRHGDRLAIVCDLVLEQKGRG